MFEKISAFWKVFRAGESVVDPVAWKRGQITVAMLTTFGGATLALLQTFSIGVQISTDQLAAIAGGLLAAVGVFNHLTTAASTDKIDALGRTGVQSMAEANRDASATAASAEFIKEPLQNIVETRSNSQLSSNIERDFLKKLQRDSLSG